MLESKSGLGEVWDAIFEE